MQGTEEIMRQQRNIKGVRDTNVIIRKKKKTNIKRLQYTNVLSDNNYNNKHQKMFNIGFNIESNYSFQQGKLKRTPETNVIIGQQ